MKRSRWFWVSAAVTATRSIFPVFVPDDIVRGILRDAVHGLSRFGSTTRGAHLIALCEWSKSPVAENFQKEKYGQKRVHAARGKARDGRGKCFILPASQFERLRTYISREAERLKRDRAEYLLPPQNQPDHSFDGSRGEP